MRQAPLPKRAKRPAASPAHSRSHAFRAHILRIAATKGFAEANAELNRHREAARAAANLNLNRRSPRAERGHGLAHVSTKGLTGWTPKQTRAAAAAGVPTSVLGRALQQGADDLKQAALETPAGLAAAGKAIGQDSYFLATGHGSGTHSLHLGEEIAEQTAHDLRHPLRHPGFTALDALAVASAGAGAGSRIAGAGRALSEGSGIRAALSRPGYKGGSLLHKKAPGETNLKVGGLEVQRLEPDNPLLRPGHRLRTKALQKKLDKGIEPKALPLTRGHATLGAAPENVAGRELAAKRRVQGSLSHGEEAALRHATKGLDHAGHTALRVVASEGAEALRHPQETLARHAEIHTAEAASAASKDQRLLHQNIAADLADPKVLDYLANPRAHPDWVRAVQASKRFSRRMTARSVERGVLSKESATESLATLTRAHGREGTPAGAFYFPTGSPFSAPSKPVSKGAYSPRPSEFGMGPPARSTYTKGTLRHRTGKALGLGVVEDVPKALREVHAGRERLFSAQDLYRSALKASTDSKEAETQIPIRRSRKISPKLCRQIAADIEKARGGDETALARVVKQMESEIKASEHDGAKVGTSIPGVRWVDARLLKDITAGNQSGVAKVMRQVNRPFRFASVYARPAYVATNLPQNLLMQMIEQGLKAPGNLTRAAVSKRLHGGELTDRIDAAMGTARSESYAPRGKLGKVEQAVTGGLTRATDLGPRRAAFLYRAREKGYSGREGLSRLFNESVNENDLVAITRRARKDAVDFDSLTPAEREASDIVYNYPWLSRSTAWAGRTALNRPINTAALANLTQTPQAQGLLAKHVPNWAKGYLSIGGKLVNPNSAGPFSTQGELMRDVPPAVKPMFSLGRPKFGQQNSLATDFGTPALQALAGVSPITQTAPAYAAKRLGMLGGPGKTFPDTGAGPALGPWLAGGLYPRHADQAALAKQAAPLSGDQTIAEDAASQNVHLQNLVRKGVLPKSQVKEYRHALDLYNERNALNSQIEKAVPNDHPRTREIRKLLGLIALLEQHGLMSQQKANEYRHAYHSSTERTVKELRSDRNAFWEETVGPMLTWYREKSGAND